MKERLETKSRELQKLKKESKRYNINSFSSNDSSDFDFSRGYNRCSV